MLFKALRTQDALTAREPARATTDPSRFHDVRRGARTEERDFEGCRDRRARGCRDPRHGVGRNRHMPDQRRDATTSPEVRGPAGCLLRLAAHEVADRIAGGIAAALEHARPGLARCVDAALFLRGHDLRVGAPFALVAHACAVDVEPLAAGGGFGKIGRGVPAAARPALGPAA